MGEKSDKSRSEVSSNQVTRRGVITTMSLLAGMAIAASALSAWSQGSHR